LDGIIIAIPCAVIAFFFSDTLSRLGYVGPMVGFLLALPYFGYLSSDRGNGQTLGLGWMNLRIVDVHGDLISLDRSMIRYTLWVLPCLLNGLALPMTRTPWIVTTLVSAIVFGLGGANIYLLLFNRRTRQGVHDLAARSYVVDATDTGPLHLKPIWKPH
jgi:uncharacterized RDD family membrane protein YckC